MKKDKRQFILDTLMVYKNDSSKRGVEVDGIMEVCKYKTKDGNVCAIGQHMKEGPWQKSNHSINILFYQYEKEDVLTQEALEQGLTDREWVRLQICHDHCAKDGSYLSSDLINLEHETGIKFPELY